ncbi:MAG: glycosyltransferase family 2 protein [Oscillospiraceae bacterium]|nr:glycosyltransferase family 2 protein [Oscillospiraceae bacterium]
MSTQKISVVIPAYNVAQWISRSLESLLAQTHPDLEIIVVDDGSTDNTASVMKAYTEEYPNIRYIQKENGGVTSARLRGAAEATGDWVAFMDGDDYVEPQMYARLLEIALEHDADIAHCGHQIHFPGERIEFVHNTGVFRHQDRRMGLRDLLDNNEVSLSLCTKLYRRHLFEGVECWMDTSIKYNEDLMMNYYLFGKARSAIFEGVCPYHYILRPGSASYSEQTEKYFFDPIRVRQILLERCGEEMRDDVRQSLMRNMLFNYAVLDVRKDRKQYAHYRKRVRKLLLEQKPYCHLLSLRNRILVNLVYYAPWLFHIAYGLYVKLFQKEEQH